MYSSMIKHAKDTYSAMPIQPKANPLNSVDGMPCWAGKLTEPMPAHPTPVAATVESDDELTPEKWLAQRAVKRTPKAYAQRRIIATGALRPGSDKVEFVADAALNAGKAEIVTGAAFNVAYVSEEDTMLAALDALRAQVVTPVARLSDEQLAEIEAERPGEDFSTKPFLF